MQKSRLSLLAAGFAAAMAASGAPRVFTPNTTQFFGRPPRNRKPEENPTGSKLALKARKQMVAVRHGGARLDSVDGIRFKQIHK